MTVKPIISVRQMVVRMKVEWEEAPYSEVSLELAERGCRVNIRMLEISENVW